mmetsp:Transcript_57694/g.137254  ORF Transcript_57694/g.137254 Transcript_57694/m.137254 type:complete len:321 (+) Transcript_57694:76-1038(+)
MAQKMMPGDWNCPNCGDLVFARNAACRRCGTPKGGDSPRQASSRIAPWQQSAVASNGHADAKLGDWHCPSCYDLQFGRNSSCRRCGTPRPGGHVENDMDGGRRSRSQQEMLPPARSSANQEMRPGDWFCPACGDLVFAKHATCRRCNAPKPPESEEDSHPNARISAPFADNGGRGQVAREGDWYCGQCGDLQFARNSACRKCGAPRSRPLSLSGGGGGGATSKQTPRPGDWFCPNCGDLQFAKNASCRRCNTPKDDDGGGPRGGGGCGGCGGQKMMPGDWVCPQCKDLQFARNNVCRICRTPRPSEDGGRRRSRSPFRDR